MNATINEKRAISSKFKKLENKWNERFILDKIPQYDAYKDLNYISLGLIRTKLRQEEKQLKQTQYKTKKLRKNSSRRTFNSKPKKSIYAPLLTLMKENEKPDLFSLKINQTSSTIKEKKLKMNRTSDYKKKVKLEKILKLKNDKKEKENSIKTMGNKYMSNKENMNIFSNNNINNNEQQTDDEDTDSQKEVIVLDQELQDELNSIKELWDNLGVTQEYQIYFGEMLDKLKTREIIEKYLSYEKKQLNQFKSDLETLMNDIYKRENDLNNLKKIEEIYSKNEELNKYNILKNKKIKNMNSNEYDIDNIENSKEYEEELNKYKISKEKIENDIDNCLKLLRLHTINTVSQFTKFRINYNFYFTSGKNDVNQMKNGYEFDYNYLLKIKKDCEFFKKSSIKNIYNFSHNSENDPFFLNLLENNNKRNNKNKKQFKYLTATEDTLNNINQCMFILDQEEMYFKISQNLNNNQNSNNENNTNNSENNDSSIEYNTSNSKKNIQNPIGTNFQGNLENVISKLKSKNEYENLFFNSGEKKEPLITNTNIGENCIYNGPNKIPKTSSNELIQSFQYYDKIKKNLFNKEEIQNMQKEVHKNNSRRNSNKIAIYSKNIQNNQNIDKFSLKTNSNLKFNHIYNVGKNENEYSNSIKISFNSTINRKNSAKKIFDINNNNNNNNNNNIEQKINENLNNNTQEDNNINDNNKNIENNKNNDINNNINDNNKSSNDDNNNLKNIFMDFKKNNSNNIIIDNNDKSKKEEDDDNNIIEEIIINNDEEENNTNLLNINCKYVSILSLADKSNKSLNEENNNNKFNIGSILFKSINIFNLNLLLNSLKNDNKYIISNTTNSIISSSPEEVKNSFNYIKNQKNNISNINTLKSILNENEPIYLSDNNAKNYAFSSFLVNVDIKSLISFSIKYNNYNYNGIKINSSKDIIAIEDDIILYTIPTNDENILIYFCPYNYKINEIIKKYDKYKNIFNGFSCFVNLISLYLENNANEDNDPNNEKILWLPCFEIDAQLICNKIPGYKKISIRNSKDNKEFDIYEYDEIIKISMMPKNNSENNNNIEVNKNEDIVIENDFIFGIYHKQMENKYNNPFISLAYIGKDNFINKN